MATLEPLRDAELGLSSQASDAEIQKREVENCVPFAVRSFSLGSRAVVEWATRRSYLPNVHEKSLRGFKDPWKSCAKESLVEVRYRHSNNGKGDFQRRAAHAYTVPNAGFTTHRAWIELQSDEKPDEIEFVVGSRYHGWSSIQRLNEYTVWKGEMARTCRPKRVHTAYGRTPDSYAIQWATMGECIRGTSYLELTEGYLQSSENAADTKMEVAATTLFTDDGEEKAQQWMHVVQLKNLKPNTRYTYRVGNPEYESWSLMYSFKTAPAPDQVASILPQRFLVTGDIGYQNAATLPMMQSEVAEGVVDAVVSMGDYAYDLHLANGHVGNIFMDEMEPIAAWVPFMVATGNHEEHNAFSHYSELFRLMPANAGTVVSGHGEAPNSWFYSYNVGLVHFVVLSTEIYFKHTPDKENTIRRQQEWLEKDLSEADRNRQAQPWVIVMAHRPMYCTSDEKNCEGKKAQLLREQWEDLFFDHGVDLYICGHQHNYERAYDVYKGETWHRTTNMRATTHILTGASGQYELYNMRTDFELPEATWDAFRNSVFGYSRLQVYNATHIHWQQVEADPENPSAAGLYGTIADDVWLVQEHHGSFQDRSN